MSSTAMNRTFSLGSAALALAVMTQASATEEESNQVHGSTLVRNRKRFAVGCGFEAM